MDRRKFITGTSALALAGCSSSKKFTRRRFEWRMATVWTKDMPVLQGGAELFAKKVAELSERELTIQVYPAGELMNGLSVFKAASEGEIECYHAASYYWAEKDPACQWFCSVPFGMNTEGALAWMQNGHGLSLWTALYEKYNLVPYPMGATGMQMGGWFTNPLNTPADINDLRIRIPGLAGRIYEYLGATIVPLSPADIFEGMKSGKINATDWIGPYMDTQMGLDSVAPYYYYPGWHEPSGILELGINRQAYETLPTHLQEVVKASAQCVTLDMTTRFAALNAKALHKIQDNKQVRLVPFPQVIMELFHRMADEVLENEAGKTVMARQIHEDYKRFLAQWLDWGTIANLGYFDLMR